MTDLAQSPASFGKYLLDQEIARGGMSRVYRARLRGPGGFEKTLVVKQILPELARDPSFIELFVKEANTLVQMSHPSLVPVYELGVVDGVYFLAMEWVEGATIAEILRDGPLNDALVAHVGAEIAEALRYAHERFEIVHRDVTPRNVIIDGAGHARLLDFGIAAKVTQTGQVSGELFGSPGYMPPEQLRGEALGPETDLFALGAVLYEAASGKPALPRITAPEAEPVSVPALQDSDPALAALIAKLLQSERAARPGAASEVALELRRWLAERHPHGVERELSERAARAHAARETQPRSLGAVPATESSGRIEVRSIATSPVLDELLKQATERIEREPVVMTQPEPPLPEEPESDLMSDPEAQATFKRYARDLTVLLTAVVAALYWAEHHKRPELAEGMGEDGKMVKSARAPEPVAPARPSPVVPTAPVTPAATPTAPPAATRVPPPPAAGAEAPAPSEAAATAYVTISATPWANVRIDARTLGVTPRRHVAVRPGKHTLHLDCPPLAKEAHVPFELRAAQSQQILVDLNQTPPKVEIR
ncbi:MAG TPA: serine/threonine-protein kinase [Polyangiales bacterium]|nr:serine/threonine-protein kinase [Polyangiales bacterium]